MPKKLYVYIMTNATNTVLYTGVTGNLAGRMIQHKQGMNKSFTRRYKVNKLVYYEEFDDALMAVKREKQIKAGSRKKKLELIKSVNPERRDLAEGIES